MRCPAVWRFNSTQPGSARLKALMEANALDGAYLLDGNLVVLEDAAAFFDCCRAAWRRKAFNANDSLAVR